MGGYYGTTSKGFGSMTQGVQLSLTILNMVVYMVMRHWLSLVEKG